jgi:hypothetical protein
LVSAEQRLEVRRAVRVSSVLLLSVLLLACQPNNLVHNVGSAKTLELRNLDCATTASSALITGEAANTGGQVARGVVVTADVTDQAGVKHAGSYKFAAAIPPGESLPFSFDVSTDGKTVASCAAHVDWSQSLGLNPFNVT